MIKDHAYRALPAKGNSVTTYASDFGHRTNGRGSAARGQPNTLLMKSPVGKSKPSTYSLPTEEHVYGKLVDRNPDESTAQAMTTWQTKQKSKNVEPALDYLAMNKLCIQKGIVDSRGQSMHRLSNPIRVKVVDHSAGRRFVRRLPSDNNPNFTYGKPTRPSSPVGKLMSDQYQREYEAEMQAREEERLRSLAVKRNHPTRSGKELLVPLQKPKPKHYTIFERDPATLFKMPRFQGVPSRVVCHREPTMGGLGASTETV